MALQKNRDIRRVAVIGGGTTGHLSALFLSEKFPEFNIDWIFPEDNNPIGVGEALVPDVSDFLTDLGITHQDIITHCNGTLKLGIKFVNWNGNDDTFTFPFGVGEGDTHNTSSIDRIMETSNIPVDMLNYPDISVHMRTTEALPYIQTLVEEQPNVTIHRRLSNRKEAGKYDLVIDAAGFRDKLKCCKSKTVPIPNNKALSYRHPYTNVAEQLVPYSTFVAMDHGWIWNIPLGDQLAMGYVFDDNYDVKDEFIEYIEQTMGVPANKQHIDEIKMCTGRQETHLEDNIVSIGLSSSFIEPLESTGLYLVTSALKRLQRYIIGKIDEDEYNRETNYVFDTITHFIIAHYKYSERSNEYWDKYKPMHIGLYDEIDIFPIESWKFILSGFGMDERPVDKADVKDLINIFNGTPYYEWIKDESNFK